MRKIFAAALILASAAAFASAQQRDFLTTDEIEKIREAQEPNQRLQLYVLFARQRVDQLQKLLDKDKKGRSLAARELLDDYSRIIEAIDTVSDDALKHKADIAIGAAAVNTAEKRFLGQLQKIEEKAPPDLDLYAIALKEAIASTNDSMELASMDAGKRSEQLSAEEQKEKEDVRKVMAAEEANGNAPAGVKTAQAKTEEAAPKRKAPTLYRKDEKPPPAPPVR